jgi:hypothetical protein
MHVAQDLLLGRLTWCSVQDANLVEVYHGHPIETCDTTLETRIVRDEERGRCLSKVGIRRELKCKKAWIDGENSRIEGRLSGCVGCNVDGC